MARRKSELIGPMSLQPVAHHSTQAVQSPAAEPMRSTQGPARRTGGAKQDAVQAAKAKISRRNSLKKQRQLLKAKGASARSI